MWVVEWISVRYRSSDHNQQISHVDFLIAEATLKSYQQILFWCLFNYWALNLKKRTCYFALFIKRWLTVEIYKQPNPQNYAHVHQWLRIMCNALPPTPSHPHSHMHSYSTVYSFTISVTVTDSQERICGQEMNVVFFPLFSITCWWYTYIQLYGSSGIWITSSLIIFLSLRVKKPTSTPPPPPSRFLLPLPLWYP